MILGLIAAIGIVTFPGGGANEFAKFVADSTHQNVVLYQSVLEDLPKIEFDADDLTTMSRKFRATAGIQIAPGTKLILSDGLIDPDRLAPVPALLRRAVWKSLPANALVNGMVTWRTKDEDRLDPATLTETHWSKPLKVHWFFRQVPVSVAVADMPEQEFLTYVAKAVGGRLLATPKEYTIDIDANEIRTRAIKRMQTWPAKWKPEPGEETSHNTFEGRFKIIEKTLEAAKFETIYEALKTNASTAKFSVANTSPIVGTLVDLAKPQMKNDPATNMPGFQTAFGFLHLPEAIENPVEVKLTAQFDVTVLCHVGEHDGKPAYVSLTWSGN